MSVKVGLNGTAVLALAALAAAGLGLWYAGKKLPELGQWAGQALNPASPDNLAYRGLNAAGGALVSEPDGPGKNADGSWSFGGWLRDITSSDDEKIKAMLQGSAPVYGSTVLSDAQAAEARHVFAQQDPRRLDL